MTDRIITEDEFDAEFKPIESPGQQAGSHLWERHEIDAAMKAGTITEKQVWTFVDDGEGGYGILPGFHMVNKIEYMVTEVPADEDVTVEIPDENDDEDGAPCCADPECPGNPCTFPGYAANH